MQTRQNTQTMQIILNVHNVQNVQIFQSMQNMHIWELKARGSTFDVKWKVLDRGAPFTPVTGRCNLCTKEKFYILRKPEIASFNSSQEVGNHCRHIAMSLLSNVGKVKVQG